MTTSMEPKSIQLGTARLAYYESAGRGPAVVFIHGNSFSGLAFSRQFESPLGEKYRLVAIDLPGHGASAWAEDPGARYTMAAYAEVLSAAAGKLGLDDGVFVGWSLGGHIVLEASGALKKARGFMVFGAPPIGFPAPLEEAFLPNPATPAFFKSELSDEEVRAMAASVLSPGASQVPGLFTSDIRRTDGRARVVIGKSLAEGKYRDEAEIAANLVKPLAVVHGAEDQIVNPSYLRSLKIPALWRGSVQTIAGAGHALQWEQPGPFNTLLEEFAEDTLG